jgi:DNA-directed RNA polymerase subunit RPC12/RpoP
MVQVRYQCLNCGNEFAIDVLTPDEQRERRRRNEPVYAVACPKCHRQDLRKISNS